MQEIDLVDFTNSKYKIPSALLTPKTSSKISSWKIFGAYSIDLMLVLNLTFLLRATLKHGSDPFIVTYPLKKIFLTHSFNYWEASSFPLIMMSYFFFCYFMNEGKTLGHHVFKTKLKIPNHSLGESFVWSFLSTLFCFTWGLAYMIFGEKFKTTFSREDFLYQQLLEDKVFYPVDLIGITIEDEKMEENYSQAA